jgi:hypothetical protein
MVVQMFATESATPIAGYNQTIQFQGMTNNISILIGDAPGAASLLFEATRGNNASYAGLAVRLIPV